MRSLRLFVATSLALAATSTALAEGMVDELLQRFASSEIQLLRARSNAPLLPLAWVSGARYGDARFTRPDGSGADLEFDQSSLSQGAFLPLPLGRRDVLVVGEWVSKTRFRLRNTDADSLNVLSAAVPVGWARQTSEDWQLAAFVAPLGHRKDGDWYWETLGGVFARHFRSDRVAWIFGLYFDVSSLEDFYTPYLGATWIINERWTLSAVLPWPAITYAPGPRTLFRLGIAPSGASWSLESETAGPRASVSAWNLGLSAERRVVGNIWLGAEAGFSGIRGLTVVGNHWQSAQLRLDDAPYALVRINFRPPAASKASAN